MWSDSGVPDLQGAGIVLTLAWGFVPELVSWKTRTPLNPPFLTFLVLKLVDPAPPVKLGS